jgi:hypothetical protein
MGVPTPRWGGAIPHRELLDMADFLTVQRSKTRSFMVFDQGDERPFFACSPGMLAKDLMFENSFMTIQAESSS